jgi:hypothetical protein
MWVKRLSAFQIWSPTSFKQDWYLTKNWRTACLPQTETYKSNPKEHLFLFTHWRPDFSTRKLEEGWILSGTTPGRRAISRGGSQPPLRTCVVGRKPPPCGRHTQDYREKNRGRDYPPTHCRQSLAPNGKYTGNTDDDWLDHKHHPKADDLELTESDKNLKQRTHDRCGA